MNRTSEETTYKHGIAFAAIMAEVSYHKIPVCVEDENFGDNDGDNDGDGNCDGDLDSDDYD